MSVTITVDLGRADPSDIARAAKFMLLFAGFDEKTGMSGNGPQLPLAAGVGGNVNVARDLPLHPSIAAGLVQPDPVAAFSPPAPNVPVVAPNGVAPPPPPIVTSSTHLDPLAPPPPPPGIEVDAQGVPWDLRIHSGSRAKVQDGTWRQKRNLNPDVFKAVMDELRHTMNVERRAPQPPAPPVPQQVFAPAPVVPPIPLVPIAPEVPPAPFVDSAVPPAPPISGTAPAGTPPLSAGAAPSASPSSGPAPTFPQLMQKITAGFHAKSITQADILRAVQAVGLTALPMLAARPDLVPAVATELGVAL